MNLSPHFTLEEMLYSDTAIAQGIDNTPDAQSMQNLSRVAQVMEQVRYLLDNHSIIVSSGYRGPELNAAIGGATESAHLYGLACDFTCPDFGTPEEICRFLEDAIPVLGIDQLIWEFYSWVHLGLSSGDPRCMALTINDSGIMTGFV
jgi:hypothetical protein